MNPQLIVLVSLLLGYIKAEFNYNSLDTNARFLNLFKLKKGVANGFEQSYGVDVSSLTDEVELYQ